MIITGAIFEDAGATILARITGHAGSPITQASLSSIAYKVFDRSGADPDTATQTGTLTISTVVYDALQLDARWTVDASGYNFLHAAPAAWFPDASHRYRIEYKLTPAAGEIFWVIAEITTKPIYSS